MTNEQAEPEATNNVNVTVGRVSSRGSNYLRTYFERAEYIKSGEGAQKGDAITRENFFPFLTRRFSYGTNAKTLAYLSWWQFQSGIENLRSGLVFRRRGLLFTLVVWVAALIGDAGTTFIALSSDSGLVEHNAWLAPFFRSPGGALAWVIGSTLLYTLMLTFCLGTFKNPVTWLLKGACWYIILYKVYAVGNNVYLLLTR